jgi:hypothetical protein
MDFSPLFAATIDGQWRPGIGDPTPLGWATVVAYLAASGACWRAAATEKRHAHRRPNYSLPFWSSLGLLLLLLGLNKQLDLQSALTDLGRRLARAQGWYDRRHEVQARFILVIAAIGLVASGVFCWMARRAPRDRLLAVVGLVFLVVFILVRASSFHQFDRFLGLRLGGLRWNWILELGGIGCVGLAALRSRQAARAGGSHRDRPSLSQARATVRALWKL